MTTSIPNKVSGFMNPSHMVIVPYEFDVDPNGNPLLPPNGTIDPKPEVPSGKYLAIVRNQWHLIDIPQVTYSFEYKKQMKLEALASYKEWYLNQPVTYDGRQFDNDETSKNRLIQTIKIYELTNQLPPAWIDYNNQAYPINAISQINGIVLTIASTFQTRFFEMATLRDQINAAQTEEELAAINVPRKPGPM